MQIEALPRDCEKLKNIYNSLLDRIKKGEKYLDDPLISNGDKEETIPHFIKLTRAAGAILRELKLLGIDYSEQEFENGFKIGGDAVEQGNYNKDDKRAIEERSN